MADLQQRGGSGHTPVQRVGASLRATATAIAMVFVYYAVVTPVALLLRALGKDSLRRRFDPDARSYWIRRDPGADRASSMTSQF